ncbi:MAG: MFS transporter [Burkholderiales bacterium]|nr:MFS transporter [Burkholderiales bacterium]MDE2455554.1 MFS transporter [Burkholderiales bacterium]
MQSGSNTLAPAAKRSGIFPGWGVVAGSGAGIAFGSAVFVAQCFSLLAVALGAQFGWSQPQLAKAASIVLLLQMVMYPTCGWALDRWGSRKVGSASILLFALSLVLLSRIGNSLAEFYFAFVLIGLLGTGTNVISYARAITLWFDRRRGLALGLAAGAQAIGGFVLPIMLQKIIAASGWSTALVVLAGFEAVVCFPIVALLVKDSPAPYGLTADGDAGAARPAAAVAADDRHELSGLIRQGVFWKMAIAFAIMGMTFYAWATNVAFVLTKTAGMTLAQVAIAQAITGVAFLFGRVIMGWLLDKVHAARIAVASLAMVALFFLLVVHASTPTMVLSATVLFGFAAGGENDLLPYLAGRYFGTHAVSKVFGWFLSAYVIGAAIGPFAFAQASSIFGGPVVPLYGLMAVQIVPALLFLSLGPYREKRLDAH